MTSSAPRCQATTRQGAACLMPPSESGYCFNHDPGRAADRAAARRKGGLHRKRPPSSAPGAPGAGPAALQSVDDVLGVLERALTDAFAGESGTARHRTAGYLCGHALAALKLRHEVRDMTVLAEEVRALRAEVATLKASRRAALVTSGLRREA